MPRFLAAADIDARGFHFATAVDGGSMGERAFFAKAKISYTTMMPLLHWRSLALLVTPCYRDGDTIVCQSWWLWACGGEDPPQPGIFVDDAARPLVLRTVIQNLIYIHC